MTAGPEIAPLSRLVAGQEIPFGGDRVVRVDADLAERFAPGDRLVVVQASGALLHIPAAVHTLVDDAVTDAVNGFAALSACSDESISEFFELFAAALADDEVFSSVMEANSADVARATNRGRSTTRLVLDETMRWGMIDGLRSWRDSDSRREGTIRRVDHAQWSVDREPGSTRSRGFRVRGPPERLRRRVRCRADR